jgi:tetratricopeptide (TPR) repeat protein
MIVGMAESEDPRGLPRWHALLASRLVGLEDIRARIWELGQRSARPIWVSEIVAKDAFSGKPLDYIQVVCLKQVRTVPKFICLLDGSFGTTWNQGQISILELELATAAFSNRDIWIFLLAPFDAPDRRIESLLRAIETSCPTARIRGPMTQADVLAGIALLLEPVEKMPDALRVGPFVQHLALQRAPIFNFSLGFRDVQFLNGEFAPLFNEKPDRELIEGLIEQAADEEVIPAKLAKLWIAIRHLSAAPFSERCYDEFLPLWESALGRWSSASAWYGLHGHFYLGRLAAVNSLAVIRARMPAQMRRQIGSPSIFINSGAAASEYYSMAKLVPSHLQSYLLLRKALWNCNVALQDKAMSDPTGILDIRGHVRLRMFDPLGALSDLEHALALRRASGLGPGAIGESEMHLGRAYSVCRRYSKAERLLEEGVAKLETTDNHPFVVQGLRHLAAFYAQVGRRSDAIRKLRKAQSVARDYEIQGQLDQVEHELGKLGELP